MTTDKTQPTPAQLLNTKRERLAQLHTDEVTDQQKLAEVQRDQARAVADGAPKADLTRLAAALTRIDQDNAAREAGAALLEAEISVLVEQERADAIVTTREAVEQAYAAHEQKLAAAMTKLGTLAEEWRPTLSDLIAAGQRILRLNVDLARLEGKDAHEVRDASRIMYEHALPLGLTNQAWEELFSVARTLAGYEDPRSAAAAEAEGEPATPAGEQVPTA